MISLSVVRIIIELRFPGIMSFIVEGKKFGARRQVESRYEWVKYIAKCCRRPNRSVRLTVIGLVSLLFLEQSVTRPSLYRRSLLPVNLK